jgi:hypothetical protein
MATSGLDIGVEAREKMTKERSGTRRILPEARHNQRDLPNQVEIGFRGIKQSAVVFAMFHHITASPE